MIWMSAFWICLGFPWRERRPRVLLIQILTPPVPLSIGRQSDIKLGETYTGLGLGLLEEDKVAAHVHQLVLVVLVFAAMRVAATMAKEESGPPVHAAVTVGTSWPGISGLASGVKPL